MPLPSCPPQGCYPFQKYLDDKSEFRKLIFRDPFYNRHWPVWQPLAHLTDEFLDKNGDIEPCRLAIRPGDQEKMMAIVRRFSTPHEMTIINELIRYNGAKKEVPNALCVLIRRHFPEAHRRAEADWARSDFRYDHEFFAIHFGKVPRNTPYTKKTDYKLVHKDGKWYTLKVK